MRRYLPARSPRRRCSRRAAAAASPRQPRRRSLWLDATGSTRGDESLQLDEAREVVREAARREADLLVEQITAASGNPVWRRFSFRAAKGTAGSPDARERDLRRQADRAMTRVAALVRTTPRSRGTDVLGALSASAQTLADREGKRETVLLTDVLDSRVLATRLRRGPLARLLERMRKRDETPNLRGVRLRFAIATTDARDGLSGSNLVELERFWRRYAAAAHAPRPAYGPLVGLGRE